MILFLSLSLSIYFSLSFPERAPSNVSELTPDEVLLGAGPGSDWDAGGIPAGPPGHHSGHLHPGGTGHR